MSEKHTLAPVFGTTETERSLLDPSIWSDRFKDLDQGGKCMAEYVWIGGTGVCVCVCVGVRDNLAWVVPRFLSVGGSVSASVSHRKPCIILCNVGADFRCKTRYVVL